MVIISKVVKIFIAEIFLSRAALFMSTPFLAVYLASQTALTPVEIGVVVGVNPLMGLAAIPLVKRLANKISLQRLLVVIPIVWSVILFGFPRVDSYGAFLLLNMASGLCYALYEPHIKSALGTFSTPEERLKVYNLRYAAINWGAIIGPLAGQLLHLNNTLKGYYLLGVIYLCIGVVNCFIHFEENRKPAEEPVLPLAGTFHSPVFITFLFLLMGTAFNYFSYGQFTSTISQFIGQVGQMRTYRLLLSATSLLIVVLQFPVLKITKRLSNAAVLSLSNLLYAGQLLIVPFFPHLSAYIGFVLFYTVAELLLGARFDYAIDTLALAGDKSFFFSLGEFVKLGSTLGPIVGGQLISVLHWQRSPLIFSCLAGITLLGNVFLAAFGRRADRLPVVVEE